MVESAEQRHLQRFTDSFLIVPLESYWPARHRSGLAAPCAYGGFSDWLTTGDGKCGFQFLDIQQSTAGIDAYDHRDCCTGIRPFWWDSVRWNSAVRLLPSYVQTVQWPVDRDAASSRGLRLRGQSGRQSPFTSRHVISKLIACSRWRELKPTGSRLHHRLIGPCARATVSDFRVCAGTGQD